MHSEALTGTPSNGITLEGEHAQFSQWIIQWADPVHRAAEPVLHACALHLLSVLFAKCGVPLHGLRQLEHLGLRWQDASHRPLSFFLIDRKFLLILHPWVVFHDVQPLLHELRQCGIFPIRVLAFFTNPTTRSTQDSVGVWRYFSRKTLLNVIRPFSDEHPGFCGRRNDLECLEFAGITFMTRTLDTWTQAEWIEFFAWWNHQTPAIMWEQFSVDDVTHPQACAVVYRCMQNERTAEGYAELLRLSPNGSFPPYLGSLGAPTRVIWHVLGTFRLQISDDPVVHQHTFPHDIRIADAANRIDLAAMEIALQQQIRDDCATTEPDRL